MTRPITLLVALLIITTAASATAEHRALFVGNSYCFSNNDLISQGFAALLAESESDAPLVELVAKGGYTFTGHLEDAGKEGEQLNELLATEGASWTVVVLQEQSIIPAYHAAIATGWYESLGAAEELDELAEKAGADTIFLMTWGRRQGLAEDIEFLPDFLTMQELLAGGYEKYALLTSTPERPTRVAPVGLAWLTIWNDTVAAGDDPLHENALFWRLYSNDGSHPSVLGSYLAALVVSATVTGNDPTTTLWMPEGVTPEEAQTLREVAQRTVFGEPPPPPVEVVEPVQSDASTQPLDLQPQSDLVIASDLLTADAPAPATETVTDLPTSSAPDAATPAPGRKSGCIASAEPSSLAGMALLLALLAVLAWQRRVPGR